MTSRVVAFLSSGGLLAAGLLACGGDACPDGKMELGGRCVAAIDADDASMSTGGTDIDPVMNTGGSKGSGGRDMETGGRSTKTGGVEEATGGMAETTGGMAETTGGTPAMDDGGMPDAMMVDPCAALSCGDNAMCVVEGDGSASCLCDEGYREGDSGCERDECVVLDGESPYCGAFSTCTDPSGAEGDANCMCLANYDSCDGPSDPNPGCETNLNQNSTHCGACNFACAGNLDCQQGTCEQSADRIEVGFSSTCFLSNPDGAGAYEVQCAGGNAANLFGPQTSGTRSTPSGLANVPRVRDIALGYNHTCVIPPAGDAVTCWGSNGQGQLASSGGANHDPNVPVTTLLSGIVDIAAGSSHTCGLTAAGLVYCWGSGRNRRLGFETSTVPNPTPAQVPGLTDVVEIDSFGSATCARKSNDRVVCWGGWTSPPGLLPTTILESSGQPLLAKSVHVGGVALAPEVDNAAFCAHTTDDRVECWGNGGLGLVDGTVASVNLQGTRLAIADVVDVSMGYSGSCAVVRSGQVYCWGVRDLGPPVSQGGQGIDLVPPTVVPLPHASDRAIDVEVGGLHMCVRLDDGAVVCRGANQAGQLGRGTVGDFTPSDWGGVLGYPNL